jgi:hypothetical protein
MSLSPFLENKDSSFCLQLPKNSLASMEDWLCCIFWFCTHSSSLQLALSLWNHWGWLTPKSEQWIMQMLAWTVHGDYVSNSSLHVGNF